MSGDAATAVTVRRAGLDDAPKLAQLRWIWRTTERGEQGLPQADFEAAFRRWWHDRERSHIAFIAERDGHVLGMAWLAIFARMPSPDCTDRLAGNVQSVYVLSESRNQGIGQALVEEVIAEAKTRRLGYLIVHPSGRSFPFYERLGFGQTSDLLYLRLRASRSQ